MAKLERIPQSPNSLTTGMMHLVLPINTRSQDTTQGATTLCTAACGRGWRP